jgi:integrase
LREALGDSRSVAKRQLPAAVARLQAEIDQARAQATARPAAGSAALPPGRPLSIRQMAVAHYADQMRFDDEARNTDHRYSIGHIDEAYVAALRRVVSGAASNKEVEGTVGVILAKFRERGSIKAEAGSPKWREIARALAGVELEALARTAERDEGDFTGAPSHPLLTEPEPIAASDPAKDRIMSDDSVKPLSELLPAFLGERGASPSMQREHHVSVRMFEEHLGEPRPVYTITRKDVNAYKRALMEAPARYTKRFPGKTLPEAIEANKTLAKPFEKLNAVTVNNKLLSRLHALLNWCMKNDIIPDNPASGVKVDAKRDKGRPPRVDFTPSELALIFGPPFFAPGKPFDETHWAMLISLFAGTRPSELAQVALDSVRHERGVLVFAIEGETKNIGSQRLIPVHRALIDLGLEQRVAELRKGGVTHLFPIWYGQGQDARRRAEAKAEATGMPPALNQYYPKFLPKRVNVTYLPSVGVKAPGKDFYSFRHTFKTGLARAGVTKDVRDYLTGHNDQSAGAVYVHGISIETMKVAVDRLYFDGLDLSAFMTETKAAA